MGAAYYGDELAKISQGTERARRALHHLLPEAQRLTQADWVVVASVLSSHFGRGMPGIFGGQITAGDGLFIGAFMAALRPASMIEIGVASGYSSALILSFAKALGLLTGSAYLHSFDLFDKHADGNVTGALLHNQFPEFVPHWSLTTQVTTATLDPTALSDRLPPGRAIAFVDGGHNHPWPAIDLTFLRHVRQCEWALMQDVQMMERWIADAVIFGAAVPASMRGAQIAFAHWPGRKVIGLDMCYNMGAVNLRIDGAQEQAFLDAVQIYEAEEILPGAQAEASVAYLRRLSNDKR